MELIFRKWKPSERETVAFIQEYFTVTSTEHIASNFRINILEETDAWTILSLLRGKFGLQVNQAKEKGHQIIIQ